MMANSALFTGAFGLPRCASGAAKRGRWPFHRTDAGTSSDKVDTPELTLKPSRDPNVIRGREVLRPELRIEL